MIPAVLTLRTRKGCCSQMYRFPALSMVNPSAPWRYALVAATPSRSAQHVPVCATGACMLLICNGGAGPCPGHCTWRPMYYNADSVSPEDFRDESGAQNRGGG